MIKDIRRRLRDLGFKRQAGGGDHETWRLNDARVDLPRGSKISPRTGRQVMVKLKRIARGDKSLGCRRYMAEAV